MNNRVNVKAVCVLLLGGMVFAGATHLVHAFQMKRNARALLEQASLAEQEGRPVQAADHLAQYLGLVPGDAEALARYGLLLSENARDARARVRAFEVLENALRRNPSRSDLRRKAAAAALAIRRFNDARAHLEILEKEAPKDVEVLQMFGRCEAGSLAYDKAGVWYAKAVDQAPGNIGLAVEYAHLLRERLGRSETANIVIETMLDGNERSPLARLEAAQHFRQTGALDQAAKHVRFALKELGAYDLELLLLAADVARARGKPEEAQQWLDEARTRYPADKRLTLERARFALGRGQRDQALGQLRPLLKDLPDRPEELWELGNLLIDLDEEKGTQRVLARLESRAPASAYLKARLAMRRQAWGESRRALEQALPAAARLPETACQLNALLGECYLRMGNPDLAASAYRRALDAAPSWPPALRGHAAALVALGKFDRAAEAYARLAVRVPEARIERARLLLVHNLRLPPAERQWAEIERALDALDKESEVRLLRAEMEAARGRPAEASKLAEKARQESPAETGPWLFLVGLAGMKGRATEIPALLEQAEAKVGRRVEWQLAWLRYALGAGKPEAEKVIARVEESLRHFEGPNGDRVLQGLAEVALALGDRKKAEQRWRELADRRPGDLQARFHLFELVLQEGKEKEARSLLGEIGKREGGGALTAFGEAALLVQQARGGAREGLAEARRQLARAGSLRPSWSRVPLLEGEASELEGDKAQALEKYQAALDRGEVRPGVLRRVLQLLHEQGRYAEAGDLVRRLPAQRFASPELGRLGAQAELLAPAVGGDPSANRQRALTLARQAVARGSKDFRDHLWLGQIAAIAGEPKEAEQALRKARELAGDVPDTWAALILFLAQDASRKAEAEAELSAARAKLSGDKLARVLAPAYEALGKQQEAEAQYRALASGSTDAATLRNVASFYGRSGQQAQAEIVLRKLLKPGTKAPEETVSWARRTLAATLALRGGYAAFREAQELLDANGKGEGIEDRRARALVLATQPAHRGEAIRLFEGLPSQQGALPPDFRLLLARLYEANGDWTRARAELLALLGSYGKNPAYLAYYVRALLRHDEAAEAGPWVARLAGLEGPRLEVLELRVRVLHANRRSDEAADLVRAYAAEKDARLEVAAGLFDLLGRTAQAEALYRKLVETSKDPRSVFLLARHLAGRGDLDGALALCEQARKTCPPEMVATVSLGILNSPKVTREQQERVAAWLAEAIRKWPRSVVLRVRLGQLEDSRGRHAEAIAAYRQALDQAPRDVVALNNLAYLLAIKEGEAEEALALIDRAIAQAGPQATLLDTRAVVRLAAKEPASAIKDLQQALAQVPSATYSFHLAQAQLAAGDRLAAREAYRKGTRLGLREADLHRLERPALRELVQQMERR